MTTGRRTAATPPRTRSAARTCSESLPGSPNGPGRVGRRAWPNSSLTPCDSPTAPAPLETGRWTTRSVPLLHDRYQRLLDQGVHANPAAGLPSRRRRRVRRPQRPRLLARLIAHRGEVLRFIDDLRVPFTSNQAERDLRMLKVHQKDLRLLAHPHRRPSLPDRPQLHRHARRHGHNTLDVLRMLFIGTPWLPVTTSP